MRASVSGTKKLNGISSCRYRLFISKTKETIRDIWEWKAFCDDNDGLKYPFLTQRNWLSFRECLLEWKKFTILNNIHKWKFDPCNLEKLKSDGISVARNMGMLSGLKADRMKSFSECEFKFKFYEEGVNMYRWLAKPQPKNNTGAFFSLLSNLVFETKTDCHKNLKLFCELNEINIGDVQGAK